MKQTLSIFFGLSLPYYSINQSCKSERRRYKFKISHYDYVQNKEIHCTTFSCSSEQDLNYWIEHIAQTMQTLNGCNYYDTMINRSKQDQIVYLYVQRIEDSFEYIIPNEIYKLCLKYYYSENVYFSLDHKQCTVINEDHNICYQELRAYKTKVTFYSNQRLNSAPYLLSNPTTASKHKTHEWHFKCIEPSWNDKIGICQRLKDGTSTNQIYKTEIFGQAYYWWRHTGIIWTGSCQYPLETVTKTIWASNDIISVRVNTQHWTIEFFKNYKPLFDKPLKIEPLEYYPFISFGRKRSTLYHNLFQPSTLPSPLKS